MSMEKDLKKKKVITKWSEVWWEQGHVLGARAGSLTRQRRGLLSLQLLPQSHLQHLHREGLHHPRHGPGPARGLHGGEEAGGHPPPPGLRRERSR